MAEGGDKLNELHLSSEEMDRLTEAFKNDKFKKMLCDYAQEISDPANRVKYENEIKLLEQERGNSVEFIHPAPCRVLKTSAGGEQTCFINICSNEKIGKPDFKSAVTEDGRRGQCWSLPYSLFPGRQNTDPKGNKYVTYDVIFHPDTLRVAAKNKSFNDVVNDTAIDGIQKTFKVILDKTNARAIKTKYKGTPQPCVIRKPIPGYEAKEAPEQPDPLAVTYPDVAKPSESNSSFQIQPRTSKEPAKPNYTVKYRSVVDLQDYRCSRDSAPSPRPKEIVIVIDLPLVNSVRDTSLDVREKILLLESKHPAYRLELPLAYPVDEDRGEAKFNKQRRQLTVTLPVQPPQEASFCLDPGQREEERSEGEEEEEEGGGERKRGVQGKEIGAKIGLQKPESTVERVVKEELVANGEEQRRADEQEKKCKEPERKDKESEERERGDELPKHEEREEILQERREELTMQTQQSRDHDKTMEDGCDRAAAQRDCCFLGDNPVLKTNFSAEEVTTADDNRFEASSKTENQHILTSAKHLSCTEEDREPKEASTSESTPKETTKIIQTDIRDDGVSEGGAESSTFVTDVTNVSNGRHLSVVSLKQKKGDAGEGDVAAEQVLQTPELDKMPPSAALREIDADGNETVISDHSTSAGFIFQNKLMYELD